MSKARRRIGAETKQTSAQGKRPSVVSTRAHKTLKLKPVEDRTESRFKIVSRAAPKAEVFEVMTRPAKALPAQYVSIETVKTVDSGARKNKSKFSSLTIFGAGKMGGAMLDGAINAGWPAAAITVIDPSPTNNLQNKSKSSGFTLNPIDAIHSSLVLLAVKPQMLDSVAEKMIQYVGQNSVVISILAGKSIANLSARLPATQKFVRAMPNTPAAIGRGITGAFATPALTGAEREAVSSLLATMGQVEWVSSEALIDAVTAVSGSGPAYVFHLVEALAKGGVEAGLPADLALRLARATVEGAGELMHREPHTPASTLRENVTSPGGTTAAALGVLMGEDGMTELMTKAVRAALNRAKELAG